MKKQQRSIRLKNEEREKDLQAEIEFKDGTLHLDGKACPSPIVPPNPSQILSMEMKQINDILGMKLNTSPTLTVRGKQVYCC